MRLVTGHNTPSRLTLCLSNQPGRFLMFGLARAITRLIAIVLLLPILFLGYFGVDVFLDARNNPDMQTGLLMMLVASVLLVAVILLEKR